VKTTANVIGLLIVGLVILGLAKKPQIVTSFFSGLQGTLGLLTK
jgi:hypothetical protein